ncbi:MAG: Septum formation protein Maf [Anaerolineales bacterium]|nr:Septum formation protein Maf [Anaerolineales bacterium]
MYPSDSTRHIVLASASPRRHELFALLGVPFTVHTADIDEAPLPGETPAQTVARLSRSKASVVGARTGSLIVAADTLVVLDDEILGKPASRSDAVAILHRLRGRSHQVLTGVTVLDAPSSEVDTAVIPTGVWMREYTDEEITAYVASGDPMDKAGAYAIQYDDFAPVARLDGCPASVMGLPVCQLDKILRSRNLELEVTPMQSCRPDHGVCAIRALVVPG